MKALILMTLMTLYNGRFLQNEADAIYVQAFYRLQMVSTRFAENDPVITIKECDRATPVTFNVHFISEKTGHKPRFGAGELGTDRNK